MLDYPISQRQAAKGFVDFLHNRHLVGATLIPSSWVLPEHKYDYKPIITYLPTLPSLNSVDCNIIYIYYFIIYSSMAVPNNFYRPRKSTPSTVTNGDLLKCDWGIKQIKTASWWGHLDYWLA